jgi:hypothetical protein
MVVRIIPDSLLCRKLSVTNIFKFLIDEDMMAGPCQLIEINYEGSQEFQIV